MTEYFKTNKQEKVYSFCDLSGYPFSGFRANFPLKNKALFTTESFLISSLAVLPKYFINGKFVIFAGTDDGKVVKVSLTIKIQLFKAKII